MSLPERNRHFSKQRRYPRFQLYLQVAVVARERNDEHSFIFISENISIGGLLVRSDRAYPEIALGMKMELWVYLKYPLMNVSDHDSRICVMAEIVHIQRATAFGFRFLAMSPEDRQCLETFLHRISDLEPDRVVKL